MVVILQYSDQGALCDAAGLSLQPGIRVSLPAGATLTLIIPGSACYFTIEQISAGEQHHLHSTLPWRLEEQLLDPVEHYHVAHGAAGKHGTELVAVNKDWLQAALHQCELAGLRPTSVVALYSLVPWQPGQLSLWQHGSDQVLIRDQSGQGICCTSDNVANVLTLLMQSRDLPETVLIHGKQVWAEQLASLCPGVLADRIQIRQAPALEQLLTQAGSQACNLLQGKFSPPLPWAHWWQQWRWAAVLLLALMLTDLVATGGNIWRMQREIAALETLQQQRFEQAMPGAALVDARLQLERAVAGLGGESSEGLLVLLTRMAPALTRVPEAEIQSLNYEQRSNSLQLLIRSADISAVQTLRTSLLNLGLQAELQGSNSDSQGAQSRLRVSS